MKHNPHNIPLDQIVWKKRASTWEMPLKVNLGQHDNWTTKDGRPCIRIAELFAPDKCTYICHPDNFYPISDFAKEVILGGARSGEGGGDE